MNKLLLLALSATLSTTLVAPVCAQGDQGQSPWAVLSQKYDKNDDGEVSAEEYPRGTAAFGNLDRNHDGVISEADFASRGRRGRGDMSVRMAGTMAARADGDDNGEITEAEWQAFLAKLDGDDDEVLAAEELAAAVPMRGGRMSERMATRLAGMFDSDGDGEVQVAEVAALFAKLDRDSDGMLGKSELPRSGGGRGRGNRGNARPEATGVPQVGTVAPDFELPLVKDENTTVVLSSFKGDKPVALIFGSYT